MPDKKNLQVKVESSEE